MKSTLSIRYHTSDNDKWWLKGNDIRSIANSISSVAKNIKGDAVPADIEIFKLNDRKAVFRVAIGKESFFAKVFFLNNLSNRFKYQLRYNKYGIDEASNLIIANSRQINSPHVYGYGEIYDTYGFTKINIVILQDLFKLSPIGTLMHRNASSEDKCYDLLMKTIPLFISLYKANCNHIDINSGGVMLNDQETNQPVFLLDFQHAQFYDKPSLKILMFEAGYFAKTCSEYVSIAKIYKWLEKLLTKVGVTETSVVKKARQDFNYYFQTKLTRKQRKKIV
ncbi:hypothetical protein KAR91_29980 [Candidatus Pacearchaeota archaeon]|nr:hypothetical protein [Candidatus Pacearchaeota archaeon]